MNRLGLSISGLFILALLLYLPSWLEEPEIVPSASNPRALEPAYRARNLTTHLYDAEGNLNHQVFANTMEHYDLLGFVLFQKPQYTIYVDPQELPWKVTAEEGTLYNNNLIQLEKNVVISSTDETEFIQTIRTEFIEIDLTTKTMTSDQPVEITGAEYIISSNGFNADLRSRQYELIDHVQTIYHPAR